MEEKYPIIEKCADPGPALAGEPEVDESKVKEIELLEQINAKLDQLLKGSE